MNFGELLLELFNRAERKLIKKHSTFDSYFHAMRVNANAKHLIIVEVKNRTAAHSFLCLGIVANYLELSQLYASAYRAHLSFCHSSLHIYIENVRLCGKLTAWIAKYLDLLA